MSTTTAGSHQTFRYTLPLHVLMATGDVLTGKTLRIPQHRATTHRATVAGYVAAVMAAVALMFGALAMVGAMIVTAAPAPAAPASQSFSRDLPGIETTAHGVVLSSKLPHCAVEDGGPVVPCTWNVGSGKDGNGRGLSYVVRDHRGIDASFDYVWPRDPRGHGWHWSSVDSDCVVRGARYRCPDGDAGVMASAVSSAVVPMGARS